MQDPRALIEGALARSPEAVHGLVMTLAPAMQREINAALLCRNLTPHAGRHDVVDLLSSLVTALFADHGALLRSWPIGTSLEAWAARLAAAQAKAVLDQAVPLTPEQAPNPEAVEAWWKAVLAQQPTGLPVAPEAAPHALAILRPLHDHEQHALAAEVLALPVPATPRPAPNPGAGPAPRLNARHRRGLISALVITVITVGGFIADRMINDPYEDLVPKFALQARRGPGAKPARYTLGSPIQVLIRPSTPIPYDARTSTGRPLLIGVDAIALSESRETKTWAHQMSRSSDGDFVLDGVVGENLPLGPGVWTIYLVIGPRDLLEDIDTEEAVDREPPAPPVRRLRYKIEVVEPEPEPLTTTSTTPPAPDGR